MQRRLPSRRMTIVRDFMILRDEHWSVSWKSGFGMRFARLSVRPISV